MDKYKYKYKDRNQNEKIRLKIRVNPIDEKMRKNCLKWFGHIQRRGINTPMRNSELIPVEGIKKIQITTKKKTLIKVVKNDISIKEVTKSIQIEQEIKNYI